ncbi:type I polyketide synthase [Sulfitobacter sabulilitoris]|uniref:SDR family NAD(P)-dependent oxidoreductase n=1 Tax=Sulfitobacter sabulilitoris TaxID=2562655 RepID=A0A5S3PZE8_9RHOB|nr:type I polyketide synthase [Sulfitobacter sabulilitoris]TMM49316.1 SDR family NAD(P)-dependent oxidoreductase [Sulfitobacter sabulilitoris]
MNNDQTRLRQDEDIAIVGMSVTVPGARSLDMFWSNLAGGVESITRLDEDALRAAGERAEVMRRKTYVPAAAVLEGYDTFDPEFFGFSPKDAAILDPQHRKFLEVSWEAMEHAGHPPESIPGPIGVYAGCGMGSYFYFNICSNPDLVDDVGMFLLRHTGNDKDFLTTRVSHVFDLKGPSVNVQTACSTSLVAVHYACEALRKGEVDMALAGGVTIELPQGRGYLFRENEILSPDGHCHAFDHRAQGTVFGSGAGAVALRRLSDAIADGDHIWAVIKGSAINNDGAAKAGYLAPSVDGQSAAVQKALAASGVGAESIGYVECHGTGTYLGDPIEVAALTDAYRQTTQATEFCGIGSVKTNIGHLDTAAGVAGLVKTALSLHHGQIPPSLGFEAPNPAIDFAASPFRVNAQLRDWPAGTTPRRAAVNALGVGGTNAHAVLEQAPARPASDEPEFPFHILCLSGRSRAALDANSAALAAHLRRTPAPPLADVAFTLKNGRRGFEKRRVVVAETHAEAAHLLEQGDGRRVFTHDVVGEAPGVVFMFPGGGAQYPGMARDLYETEPVFAEWMDRGLDHLEPQLDYDIRALWLPAPEDRAAAEATLQKPSVQLPLIMIVEYALAQLWQSWGVRPAALVGHSMGENTAACLAGVIGFEDCIDLVLLRGRLFDTVPAGGMLSVPLPLSELEPLIGGDLDIAGLNGPLLTAVSGPQAALDRLAATLAARDIDCQRIPIDIAAHSRMLDPILSDYRAFLSGVTLNAPTLPLISNRTGVELTARQATDPDYWVEQLRQTVRFADCIDHLSRRRDHVYLEVGPGKALSALAQMHGAVNAGQVLSALRHPDQDIADDMYFFGVIGRLWATGVEADWPQVWGEGRRQRVPLPTYAFQRSRYFIEANTGTAQKAAPDLEHRDDIGCWGYRPVWRPRLPEGAIDVAGDLADAPRQRWLIFTDADGLGQSLCDRLRGLGHAVVQVRAGDGFAQVSAGHYTLAPEQMRAGYDALMRDLADKGFVPSRIVHLWLVTGGETFRPGSSLFDRNLEQGLYGLVSLAQALGDQGWGDGCHLTVVTNGAAQVRGEPLPYPEKAMISGPLGMLPREFPGMTAASLDIELPEADKAPRAGLARLTGRSAKDGRPDDMRALTDRLLEDVLADPANTVAAYRGARRFEKGYAPEALEAATDPGPYTHGGTYLVTGGFGGIGLRVAQDLVETASANVVLLSRDPLPPRAAWSGYLARHGAGDRTAARIAAVQRLEAAGGRVMVAAGDICNLAQMRRVIDDIDDAFGGLTGVIHAAGVIDDAPLMTKTDATIAQVLAPKVQGVRVLDALLPDGAIDLLVLFASSSTATRPAGQCDYVAANDYLNAFAASRAGGATRVVAVNWGVWAEVGMAAEAIARDAPLALDPVAADRDMPLIDRIGIDADGTLVAETTLSTDTHWVLDQHRTARGDALLPGTGFIEVLAEALAVRGHSLAGACLRDLYFLRPLNAPDGTARKLRVLLRPSADGYDAEVRSDTSQEGREGFVLNALARIVLEDALAPPAPLDLAAIGAGCGTRASGTAAQRLASPQEAHLTFGPQWHVLRDTALGDGEGLAHLAVPQDLRGTASAGYLLHPGLMDLATGWAMHLIDGYAAADLWVPLSYGTVTVHAALPPDVVSWVRLDPESDPDHGMARFDVTISDPDGRVLVEVTGFTIQRLEGGFGAPAAIDPRDVSFDGAPGATPHTPDQDRLAYAVSQGIRPAEGPEALRRALGLGRAHVVVSSMDLPGLIAQANRPAGPATAPGQTFDRPDLDGSYVAPRTRLETELAEMWQTLLGVNQVGVEDSFFDLGGHSLIAVRLFANIKRTYDRQFPISVLFEAPTIEKLAALIAPDAAATGDEQAPTPDRGAAPGFDHLVLLHPGNDTRAAPLFIVAGMFGNVLNLRHLAQAIGRDRAVYGVQARGLIGTAEPHLTIADAAADYLAEIRMVQPDGPYLLSGFSGGGITAYEMAQQLRAQGQDVPVLALLDTPLPVRPSLMRRDKALIKLAELRRKGPRYLIDWARDRWAWERAKRHRAAKGIAAPTDAFNNDKIEAAFRAAVAEYDVAPWPGDMTLFRPPLDRHWRVSGGAWVSAAREYVLPDNDWTQFAPKLAVIEVPGDHDSMVLSPNVAVLAQALRDVIDHALTPAGLGHWSDATAAE